MNSLRMLAIATALTTFCTVGYAQTAAEHDTHHPDAAPTTTENMPIGDPEAQMARMDKQMKAMQAMHDKMMAAKTPDERSPLMAEHMKVMQDSMAMMSDTGPDGMMSKGGMGSMDGMKDKPAMGADMDGMPGMQGKGPMDGDMGVRHQMMEKRMQMMQSMMQMMQDRMPPAPGKS